MHEYYVAYYTDDGKKVAETVWAKSPQDARAVIQSRPNFGYFTESPTRLDLILSGTYLQKNKGEQNE